MKARHYSPLQDSDVQNLKPGDHLWFIYSAAHDDEWENHHMSMHGFSMKDIIGHYVEVVDVMEYQDSTMVYNITIKIPGSKGDEIDGDDEDSFNKASFSLTNPNSMFDYSQKVI